MVFNNSYPEPVQDFCNKFMDCIVNDNMIQEHFNDPITHEQYQLCFDELCKKMLGPFLKGSLGHFSDDKELINILKELIVITASNRLKDMGMLDCIEDENGEIHWFPTQKGKEISEYEIGNRLTKITQKKYD